MKLTDTVSETRPPNPISALLAGFDAISSNINLILIPVALDLFLWLGPQISLKDLIMSALGQLTASPGMQAEEAATIMRANQEIWQVAGERINLFTVLRTLPVGVPSLMGSVLPLDSPLQSTVWALTTWADVIILALALMLLGLFIGSLYYALTARAALRLDRSFIELLQDWPYKFGRVLLLSLVWLLLLIALSIPGSLIFSTVLASGSVFGQILLLVAGGFVIWLFLPLIYSAHGIFAYDMKVSASVRKSIQITRITFPVTALFFLILVVIDQGLGIFWQMPQDDSWFLLVGIVGHAFIFTSLLAASFIYYRDADRWCQHIFEHFILPRKVQG
jgi:hypothetical protein